MIATKTGTGKTAASGSRPCPGRPLNYAANISAEAKNSAMQKPETPAPDMAGEERAAYEAEVSIALFVLRTAFPAQTRSYGDRELDALTALWLEVFAGTEPGMVRRAAMRFISADRKGFFPSPGQVMGHVEIIREERKQAEKQKRMSEHAAELQQYYRRIEAGENCATCLHCEPREFVSHWRGGLRETRLYCQNPESHKYEGLHGHGTAASIVCGLYWPKPASASEVQNHNQDTRPTD